MEKLPPEPSTFVLDLKAQVEHNPSFPAQSTRAEFVAVDIDKEDSFVINRQLREEKSSAFPEQSTTPGSFVIDRQLREEKSSAFPEQSTTPDSFVIDRQLREEKPSAFPEQSTTPDSFVIDIEQRLSAVQITGEGKSGLPAQSTPEFVAIDIQQEETPNNAGAGTSEAGAEHSRTAGAKGWGYLFITYAILGAVFTANCSTCLIARKLDAVGSIFSHPTVYSLEGSVAGLCSVIGYCLLIKFRQNKRISICLMVLQAVSTSSLVALFHGTVFGDTLLVSAVELSVTMWSLSIYTYFASPMGHSFTYTEPFLLSTSLAVAAVVILKMTVHIGTRTCLFALGAGILLNVSILRKSNKLIALHKGGDGVTEAIILYGYVVRRFLGHVSFLLFGTESN